MQSLRRCANFAVINKQFIWSAAVHNTPVNFKEDNNHKFKKVKSWRKIPGPPSFPMYIYYLFQKTIEEASKDTDVISNMYKKYGPIVKVKGIFGAPTNIFIFDAEAASQILRSENFMPKRIGFQSLDYFRTKYSKSADDEDKPSGLITDQGEVWKKFRSTVNPIMLQPKTIRLYDTVLNEVAEDVVKRMRLIRNEKNMLDRQFNEEMNLWALESIAVMALGGRLNCLDLNLPEDSPAKQVIQIVHDIFKTTQEMDFKPNLWRYFSTPLYKRSMKTYEKQAELSKFYIGKAIEELKSKRKNSTEEKGVLEKLLDIDDHVAVIMASDMLFGGVDTAANTITTTLYLLAKNQEKQIKLRKEIMSKSERRPYLRACIKEAMRILPVVHVNVRMTTKDYDILGYRIPKDMNIVFGHQLLCSLEEHYPKPKEYIPERWITDKTDPLHHNNAHPFAFSPFGFGARSCIGRRIAEIEMEIMLAKVIENFHVEWFGPPLKIKPITINYTEPPFNFVFKDVK